MTNSSFILLLWGIIITTDRRAFNRARKKRLTKDIIARKSTRIFLPPPHHLENLLSHLIPTPLKPPRHPAILHHHTPPHPLGKIPRSLLSRRRGRGREGAEIGGRAEPPDPLLDRRRGWSHRHGREIVGCGRGLVDRGRGGAGCVDWRENGGGWFARWKPGRCGGAEGGVEGRCGEGVSRGFW